MRHRSAAVGEVSLPASAGNRGDGERPVLPPPPFLSTVDATTWRRFWEPLLVDQHLYLFDAPRRERDEAA